MKSRKHNPQDDQYQCQICKQFFDGYNTYEYRGAYACGPHFDELQGKRDFERQEIMAEENSKVEKFRGLDLGDSPIGKANREILKPQIEIASKESGRLKTYEGRDKCSECGDKLRSHESDLCRYCKEMEDQDEDS